MDIKIIFRRWCDVILLGLVSYALVYLIASVGVVQVAFGKWANLFSSLHMIIQILLALTGFYCARHLLLFFNVIHKRQLKNIKLCLVYPPITFSIVLCLLLFLPQFDVIYFLSDSLFASYFLMSALLFIILLSLLCAFDSLYSEKREDTQERVLIREWIKDEEQKNHYRWLMSERFLDKCDKDMLGREVYVDRIARLFAPIDGMVRGKANHIAIVGPFGIGKTSVWKRVEPKLGDDFIFVSIDGWGRGEGTIAAQIIDEMIAKLSTYIDCASIRNVPQEYMTSLSGMDFKGLSTLAAILPLHSHHSPEKLIRKIETILLSIGKNLIVVLEDFDRNPQADNIMNEVAGLLDRLRDLRSIHFIVCLAPGIQSHLLSRISTHREDLIAFDALEFVDATLDLMKSYADHLNIDVIGLNDRETHSVCFAINGVIKTPRELKYALRRSLEAWDKLAGEVNIYDLLVINVLRYSVPEALDFVLANFNFFQVGVSNADEPNKIKDRFLKLIPQEKYDDQAVHDLIKKVFPAWNRKAGGVAVIPNFQRLAGTQGKSYLEKIIAEDVGVFSDKNFLQLLQKLNDASFDSDQKSYEDIFSVDVYRDKFIEAGINSARFSHINIISGGVFYQFLVCLYKHDLLFTYLERYSISNALKEFDEPGTLSWLISCIMKCNVIDAFRLCKSVNKYGYFFESLFSLIDVAGCSSAHYDTPADLTSDTGRAEYKSLLVEMYDEAVKSDIYRDDYISFLMRDFDFDPGKTLVRVFELLKRDSARSPASASTHWRPYEERLKQFFREKQSSGVSESNSDTISQIVKYLEQR